MTKDQRTIKAQAIQITELTNDVSRLKSDLDAVRKDREQADRELADVHATFDLLGVPRCVNSSYRSLTVNARLTLFLVQANGIKVAQPKEEQ